MQTTVVLVERDPQFIEVAKSALTRAGYSVAWFTDPMIALTGIENCRDPGLLVTGVDFGPNQQHGISLAHMARRRHPDLKVLFTVGPEFADITQDLARDLGKVLIDPIRPEDVVAAVIQMLPLAVTLKAPTSSPCGADEGAGCVQSKADARCGCMQL